jgi:hypothetical protein
MAREWYGKAADKGREEAEAALKRIAETLS